MRLLFALLISLVMFTACEKDVEDVEVKQTDTTNVEVREHKSIHERDMKEHADSAEADSSDDAEERIKF